MRKKALLLSSLIAAALVLSGCGSSQASGPQEATLLGVVTVEKDSYTPSSAATIAVSSDEIIPRKNFSGKKVSLFWGLITLKDY